MLPRDLVAQIVLFVGDRMTRIRMGYSIDRCIAKNVPPLKFDLESLEAYCSKISRVYKHRIKCMYVPGRRTADKFSSLVVYDAKKHIVVQLVVQFIPFWYELVVYVNMDLRVNDEGRSMVAAARPPRSVARHTMYAVLHSENILKKHREEVAPDFVVRLHYVVNE